MNSTKVTIWLITTLCTLSNIWSHHDLSIIDLPLKLMWFHWLHWNLVVIVLMHRLEEPVFSKCNFGLFYHITTNLLRRTAAAVETSLSTKNLYSLTVCVYLSWGGLHCGWSTAFCHIFSLRVSHSPCGSFSTEECSRTLIYFPQMVKWNPPLLVLNENTQPLP